MYFFGTPAGIALFFGFLICHSSTTITLKIFQERAEVNTPYARSTLGISLYQDIMTVPMLIALPILAGREADITGAMLNLGVTLVLLLVVVLAMAVWVSENNDPDRRCAELRDFSAEYHPDLFCHYLHLFESRSVACTGRVPCRAHALGV